MPVGLMFSAVLPSMLLLWYFYSRDKYPEPPRVVATAFLFGVATIPLVLGFGRLVELGLGDGPDDPYLAGLVDAFVYAAMPEEALKLLVMLAYVRRHSAFDEPMDGLVYGVATSLGFATLENVLYVSAGDLELAVVRAVTTLPCHCTLGAIMGYYVAQAAFDRPRRQRALLLALAVPTIFHTLYDFPLLAIARFEDPGQIPDLVGRGLTGTAFGVLGFMALWAYGLARSQRQLQDRAHESARSWARMRRLLLLGGGGLMASCGGLMIIGGLAEPGVSLVIGGVLLLAGVAVFVRTTLRANG